MPKPDRQFERLYQRHLADVYRYAAIVMRNPQDAEDVAQTTFLNAYRAMQNGERPRAPKNWLIKIAHNVCRQRFRQMQRRPQELPLFEDSAEVAVEEDGGYTAEDIQRALGYLAFNQRAALVMRELEGRSYAEIAGIMEMSVSAVETLIFRARRALREQLEGSLSCAEAELLISKQADGALGRAERGQLRAHLRECDECAGMARSQRASRGALKALFGGIPVPATLLGGGSPAGVALATKAAAVVFAGAVVGGGAGFVATSNPHSQPAPVRHRQGLSPAPQGLAPAASVAPRGLAPAVSVAPKRATGWYVPRGHRHLKITTHARVAKGWFVPPGHRHLKVVSHVKIVPAAKPHGRPANPGKAHQYGRKSTAQGFRGHGVSH